MVRNYLKTFERSVEEMGCSKWRKESYVYRVIPTWMSTARELIEEVFTSKNSYGRGGRSKLHLWGVIGKILFSRLVEEKNS